MPKPSPQVDLTKSTGKCKMRQTNEAILVRRCECSISQRLCRVPLLDDPTISSKGGPLGLSLPQSKKDCACGQIKSCLSNSISTSDRNLPHGGHQRLFAAKPNDFAEKDVLFCSHTHRIVLRCKPEPFLLESVDRVFWCVCSLMILPNDGFFVPPQK